LIVLALVVLSVSATLSWGRKAGAFGNSTAFQPRALIVGASHLDSIRASGLERWSAELVARTSAPARQKVDQVRADSSALLAEPFAVWMGGTAPQALAEREIANLRTYFSMGGVLFVDDTAPESGDFGRAARHEIGRVLPDAVPVAIGPEHVIFKSFYLVPRPVGRVEGPPKFEAIVRGGVTQVIFSSHDLTGALAQSSADAPAFPVSPGGEMQREMATRLAVNIAMFVLCTNYKDDQVHAPYLMRRRSRDYR
jgi:hypothetical protein